MPNEFKIRNGLIVDQGGAQITGSVIATQTGFTASGIFTGDTIGAIALTTTASTGFSVLTADGVLQMYDNTNAATRFYINGSGSVGIGTSSPGAKLHVQGAGTTAASTALNIFNNSNVLLLTVLDSGDVSVNKLGINITSPLADFHIIGSIRIDGQSGNPVNAPSPSSPIQSYGVDGSKYLGEPSIWLKLNLGGTIYYIPGYE